MKLVAILCLCAFVESAKILGIYSHAGKSHVTLGQTLFKALATRGHNVTMLSPFPLKEKIPNYRDIDTFETLLDMQERGDRGYFNAIQETISLEFIVDVVNTTFKQTELLFVNEEVQKLMKSDEKFDVIVMDWMLNDAHLVFSEIFNCPVILSSSVGSAVFVNHFTGNTNPYAYVPIKTYSLTQHMNFFQRALNTIMNVVFEALKIYIATLNQKALDKYVPGSKPIAELRKNVALILSNGHPSFEAPHPTVQNEIDVGGYHIESPKPLPKKIEKFLDANPNGAIYFSLGSNMKSIYLGGQKIDAILRTFAKLKLNVLWKFEDENLPNKPDNVMISKWLPQTDVLAHPNVRIFISHGGLMSVIESIHYGVPIIGIPIFGDQKANIPHLMELGIALQVSVKDISEETLSSAINEMLSDEMYGLRTRYHSELLRNQEIHPMRKAIYWVEFVIRHNGADHLKSASLNLAWYQIYLLDVIAFFAVVIFVLGYTLKFIYRIIKMRFSETILRKGNKEKIH